MVELAGRPPADYVLPDEVAALIGDEPAELVWLNLDGGLTVRLPDRYLKWSRTSLRAERERLEWAG